ncbi:hypothetical protein GCM10010207_83200 [Streptomyces atratus]|nr:hypothetical protein GCM10010207_83200 [Streptomyces atratus]
MKAQGRAEPFTGTVEPEVRGQPRYRQYRRFELLDVVGNDVSPAIQRELYLEFRKPGFATSPLLEQLVMSAASAARPAMTFATTAELRQSRQNSLPSGSAITMKPALIGGAGS